LFPDLAWITGTGKWARWIRAYLIVALAPIMAMNSGSPANLASNLVVAIVGLFVPRRFARPALASPHGEAIAVFTGRGFVGLCAYLILLYGVTYLALRREALPSLSVQLFTFVFYGVVIVGLWYHGAAPRLSKIPNYADHREWQRVTRFFAILFAAALILSTFAATPFLNILVGTTFVIWTPLGFVLTTLPFSGTHARALGLPIRTADR